MAGPLHFGAFRRSPEHRALTAELRSSLANEHGRLSTAVLRGSPEGGKGGGGGLRRNLAAAAAPGFGDADVEVAPWLRHAKGGRGGGGGGGGGSGGGGLECQKQRASFAKRTSINRAAALAAAGSAEAAVAVAVAAESGAGSGSSGSPLVLPTVVPVGAGSSSISSSSSSSGSSSSSSSSSSRNMHFQSLTLSRVLADKLGVFLFKSFCRAQFEEESMLFCLEAAAMQRLVSGEGGAGSGAAQGGAQTAASAATAAAAVVHGRAKRLYEKYIVPGSPLELRQVGAAARARVTRALLACAETTPTQQGGAAAAAAAAAAVETGSVLAAFEGVREERMGFLERVVWPRFANSQLLKGWAPKLLARIEESEWRQEEREQLDAANRELQRVAAASGLSNSFSCGPSTAGGGGNLAVMSAVAEAVELVPLEQLDPV